MEITLTPFSYNVNKAEIDACLLGEMCKIMKFVTPRVNPIRPDDVHYVISTDVSNGWPVSDSYDNTEYAFHADSKNGSTRMTGLGTFYLVNAEAIGNGRWRLKFTDDLNPDLP